MTGEGDVQRSRKRASQRLTQEQGRRLTEVAERRRLALKLNIGGPGPTGSRLSSSTWYRLPEGGTNYSTLDGVDEWLDWEKGSALDVAVHGKEPRPREGMSSLTINLRDLPSPTAEQVLRQGARLMSLVDQMDAHDRGVVSVALDCVTEWVELRAAHR